MEEEKTIYDWERLKKKALHSIPYGRGELVTRFPQMAHVIALDSMINGNPGRKDINAALDKTLEDADAIVMNWDIRNAPLLILACRKYGNFIVPKSYDLNYHLDVWMNDDDKGGWSFCLTDNKMDDELIDRREAILNSVSS